MAVHKLCNVGSVAVAGAYERCRRMRRQRRPRQVHGFSPDCQQSAVNMALPASCRAMAWGRLKPVRLLVGSTSPRPWPSLCSDDAVLCVESLLVGTRAVRPGRRVLVSRKEGGGTTRLDSAGRVVRVGGRASVVDGQHHPRDRSARRLMGAGRSRR